MNLELRSIVEPGNLIKERITLRAKSSLDVGDYLITQSEYIDDSLSTELLHTYWFPYEAVGAGDLVVLYTKSGLPRNKKLSTGKTAHFFYWGLEEPIWALPNRAAVLLHAPSWTSKAAAEL